MEDKELDFELLKSRFTAQQQLCDDFAKACTAWLVAFGFILKYAFDPAVTKEARLALCIGGIAFSFIGIIGNFFCERARRRIDADVIALNQRLASPLSYVESEKLRLVLVVVTLVELLIVMALFVRLVNG